MSNELEPFKTEAQSLQDSYGKSESASVNLQPPLHQNCRTLTRPVEKPIGIVEVVGKNIVMVRPINCDNPSLQPCYYATSKSFNEGDLFFKEDNNIHFGEIETIKDTEDNVIYSNSMKDKEPDEVKKINEQKTLSGCISFSVDGESFHRFDDVNDISHASDSLAYSLGHVFKDDKGVMVGNFANMNEDGTCSMRIASESFNPFLTNYVKVKLKKGIKKKFLEPIYEHEIDNSEEEMKNKWTMEKIKKVIKEGNLIRNVQMKKVTGCVNEVYNDCVKVIFFSGVYMNVTARDLNKGTYEFLDSETLDVILPPKDEVIEMFEYISKHGSLKILSETGRDVRGFISNKCSPMYCMDTWVKIEDGRKFLFYPETQRMVEVK